MVILLTGATGFLGSRLAAAMGEAGHDVIELRRAVPDRVPRGQGQGTAQRPRMVHGDLAHDHDWREWVARLDGVDVVVNAAGIFRESPGQGFEAVHVQGPRALFEACLHAGVSRVVQVSALGADAEALSGYHRSKRAADDFLLSLPMSAVVVRPSLLFGAGGASARLFTRLAALPLLVVPGQGAQPIQPLQVDDAVQTILQLLPADAPTGRLDLVGPRALSLREFLTTLRRALGLSPAFVLPVPAALVGAVARAGRWRKKALLDSDSWQMLQRGNTGDVGPIRQLLGRTPRAPADFIPAQHAPAIRIVAQLGWLLPLLRLSLAAVWLITAYVSLWAYPRADSLALLQQVGVSAGWAPLLLWGAAGCDLALGLATLFLYRWRPLWRIQATLILFYTAVLTFHLPQFWAHPFGPLLKNLPILAVLWLLHELGDIER